MPASPSSGSRKVVTITKVEGPTVRPAEKRYSLVPTPKLPAAVQFPLIAILSLSISALLYSLTYQFTRAPLAINERVLENWTEVALLTGWKVFQLGLGWYGNFDSIDLAALTVLSQGPSLYLLSTFYSTPAVPLVSSLAIEVLSATLPFHLLRPLNVVHADPNDAPNGDIVADRPIALLTTLLAAAIYSVALLFAYATYLPTYLVVYFTNLASIAPAHEASYISFLPVTLALGLAAQTFIFAPITTVPRTTQDEINDSFNPVEAGLGATVWWNVWGWSTRTKVAMGRTLVLMLVSGVSSALKARYEVLGVETAGAVAWGTVWVLAAGVTGLGLGAVGST
ncbi:uncharacterized protein B0I36DRAFT_358380 [Microdochium trichocladiopsis]|uniref:Uncharacterized protein n=1 Tax=Microdochium trichocladiopsis TaxID=1682393 RepID=A0A9P9BX39_9PEZI|nr:uncharacterized protein B0I36DRAFT_358380 [Microdochium trichocladiopsis]KAH7041190.1 hypothetical protein B0I36DRAFT_358380 [Microdochium trichocladiopsis]